MMFFPILIVAVLIYWFLTAEHGASRGISTRGGIDILRERYARGEIEKEEFEERLLELRKEL